MGGPTGVGPPGDLHHVWGDFKEAGDRTLQTHASKAHFAGLDDERMCESGAENQKAPALAGRGFLGVGTWKVYSLKSSGSAGTACLTGLQPPLFAHVSGTPMFWVPWIRVLTGMKRMCLF